MEEFKSGNSNKSYIEVLNAMFSGDKAFNELTKRDKERNFFLINRRIAIAYPLQAYKLSVNGISQEYAVDCLYMITKRFKSKPSWLYLKTSKETVRKNSVKFSKEAKDFYLSLNEISEKTFETALEFNPKQMQIYLNDIEKHLKLMAKSNTKNRNKNE